MEQPIAPEPKGKDLESKKTMLHRKNEKLTDSIFEQSDLEIPAASVNPRDEELTPEKETSSKEVAEPLESGSKVSAMELNKETEQTVEASIERIPIEMMLNDTQSMEVECNQTAVEIIMPKESSTISDEAKIVVEDTDTIIDSTRDENQEVSIPTTPNDTLPEHTTDLKEIQVMEPTSVPEGDNTAANENMNLWEKIQSSAVSLKEKQQSSSKSSQSFLYSSGPSSSSLCHLTELSQPKPEALRTTLRCLRQLHGTDAKHLASIERHLRGLRSGPKTKSDTKTNGNPTNNTSRNKMSKPTRTQTDENALGERQALDKFAAKLFTQLERERALTNYEVSKLQMPVEIAYYRAAYDGLVTTFGQPYHKCTLELYQQLAGELGIEAERFIMDKTPKITNVHT
uniref:Uncharacterized protein n=1 Tax=Anopheles minimus TaxID=112268 RepID=A0A182VTR4_9DIPT